MALLYFNNSLFFGHIGPEYVQYLSGTCREVTDFAVYLFRALGIPCAIDFVPVRSYVNAGHFWLVAWDKTGEAYMANFPRIWEWSAKIGGIVGMIVQRCIDILLI